MRYNKSPIDWAAIEKLFRNQGWVEFKKYLNNLDNSFKIAIININEEGERFISKYFELKGRLAMLDILKNFEYIVKENLEKEE